LNCVSNVT